MARRCASARSPRRSRGTAKEPARRGRGRGWPGHAMAVAAMALALLAPRAGRVVRRLPLGERRRLALAGTSCLPPAAAAARRSCCLGPPAIPVARPATPPAPHSSATARHDRAGAQAGRSTLLHGRTFGMVDPAIRVRDDQLTNWTSKRVTFGAGIDPRPPCPASRPPGPPTSATT